MTNKISVAIVSHNREQFMEKCLSSVSWADEVVVVDGKSTDKTAQIARKLGAKVTTIENDPLMKTMMNLAFSKCTGDWILSLDTDETITTDLKNEIINAIKQENCVAYKIPRKNMIFNKWIEHTGWYPDFQTRLFKKGHARFPEKSVHEELDVTGQIGQLKSPIMHDHIRTVSDFLSPGRMDGYTTVEANKLISEGKKITWADALRFPWNEFLRRFFAWEGYKDGLHGLVLSLLMAFYWEIVFVKIWEKQGFFEFEDESFLTKVGFEGKKMVSEFRHWDMVATKNPIKKTLLKVRNKLSV